MANINEQAFKQAMGAITEKLVTDMGNNPDMQSGGIIVDVDKKDSKYLEKTTKGMNIGVYTLFKGNIGNINIAYIRCYCPSTDRLFFLGVNSEILSAKDAIASLCQIPIKLKDNLISIKRQGEIFSFNFDENGTNLLKNQSLTFEDYKEVVSLKGDEYFGKLQFEY